METTRKETVISESITTVTMVFTLPVKIESKRLDNILNEKARELTKRSSISEIVKNRKLIKKRFYYFSVGKERNIEILWIDPKSKRFRIDITGSLVGNKIEVVIIFPKRKNMVNFAKYAKVVVRALRLLKQDFTYDYFSFTKRYTSVRFLDIDGDKKVKEYLLSKRNIKNFILKYGMKNKAFRNT